MPPRYAYWTIILDGVPTAFRAKDREDLLPTFKQLQRKNPDAVMKWFTRGRLWDSQEAAIDAARRDRAPSPKVPPDDRRGRDWRPGGEHEDPRTKFQRKKEYQRAHPVGGPPREQGSSGQAGGPHDERSPGSPPPGPGGTRPPDRRPYSPRPTGQGGGPPRDQRPYSPRPPGQGGGRPTDRRPYSQRPTGQGGGPPRDQRPYSPRPPGQGGARPPEHRAGQSAWKPPHKPWEKRPQEARGDRRPDWRNKPTGRPDHPGGSRPEGHKPERSGGRPPAERHEKPGTPPGENSRNARYDRKPDNRRDTRGTRHESSPAKRYSRPGPGTGAPETPETPRQPPPQPHGPDRPPKPGKEPRPGTPDVPEKIRILPEPPERADKDKE
jgi:hypothetical protein